MNSALAAAALALLPLTAGAQSREWYWDGTWAVTQEHDQGGQSCVAASGGVTAFLVIAYHHWNDPVLFWDADQQDFGARSSSVILLFDDQFSVRVPADYEGGRIAMRLEDLEDWQAAAVLEEIAGARTLVITDDRGRAVGQPSLDGSRAALVAWRACANALEIPLDD